MTVVNIGLNPDIKRLDDLSPVDMERAGAKASICARLEQAGFPVPDGFVLMTGSEIRNITLLELEEWIGAPADDRLFAVRSSAIGEDGLNHSFAGIHETRLNVNRGDLIEMIKTCWESVASPQAIAYRKAMRISVADTRTAILIQTMIESVVSGVAFTADPITGDTERIIINASWGLGDAIVGGLIEPDQLRIQKSDSRIAESLVGSKHFRSVVSSGESRLVETAADDRMRPALTVEQVRELSTLLMKLEEYFESPQDVEWAHDGSRFWILQSRPITRRAEQDDFSKLNQVEWTRANLREVLPDLPSPQALAATCEMLNRAQRKFFGGLTAEEAILGPMSKHFFGRLYMNLSQIRHICCVSGSPPAMALRAVGHQDNIKAEDEKVIRPPLRDLLRALPFFPRLLWFQLTAGHNVRRDIRRVEAERDRVRAIDATRAADEDVIRELKTWTHLAPEFMQTVFALSSVSLFDRPLRAICRWADIPFESLVNRYLAAGKKSVSAQQAFDLLALAGIARSEAQVREYFSSDVATFDEYRRRLSGTRFLEMFDRFLAVYGHRGTYETDWSLPRFVEEPRSLLCAIQAHVRAADCPEPEEIIGRQEREATEAWELFIRKLGVRRWLMAPLAKVILKRIKEFYLWRELYRSELVKSIAVGREWHLELARRWVDRGWIDRADDYFMLTLDEVASGAHEQFKDIIAGRRLDLETWRRIEMPLLMRESELPILIRRATAAPPPADIAELRGLCVSAGVAEGEVAIILHPADFSSMKPGAILIAPATDPSWTPLFTLAAGVIVEVGGLLSHASTVAREYGLPALANVKDATKLFKAGDRVRLDATNGIVQLLREKNEQAG